MLMRVDAIAHERQTIERQIDAPGSASDKLDDNFQRVIDSVPGTRGGFVSISLKT